MRFLRRLMRLEKRFARYVEPRPAVEMTDAELYRVLARASKWPPRQIAGLSDAQFAAFCRLQGWTTSTAPPLKRPDPVS